MKRTIYILIFTLIVIFSGCKNSSQNKDETLKDKIAPDTVKADVPKIEAIREDDSITNDPLIVINDSLLTVVGVVQSTGINNSYKLAVRANYQLISSKRDFYLITEADLSEYWGKCVTVMGVSHRDGIWTRKVLKETGPGEDPQLWLNQFR